MENEGERPPPRTKARLVSAGRLGAPKRVRLVTVSFYKKQNADERYFLLPDDTRQNTSISCCTACGVAQSTRRVGSVATTRRHSANIATGRRGKRYRNRGTTKTNA